MVNEKIRPKTLRVGDRILVQRKGAALGIATTKRDSLVASLVAPPDVVDSPVGGRRGYALDTSEGRIPFVTGVTAIMVPNAGDEKRAEREGEERERAREDSQGVLGGLDRPAPPESSTTIPGHVRQTAARTTSSTTVTPPRSAIRAHVANVTQSIPAGRGANAAANYRAMARGAVTDAARDFWETKAREALSGGDA